MESLLAVVGGTHMGLVMGTKTGDKWAWSHADNVHRPVRAV
jgi:hypothetical protein